MSGVAAFAAHLMMADTTKSRKYENTMKRIILTGAALFAAGCNCGHPDHTANDMSTTSYAQRGTPAREVAADPLIEFVGPRGAEGATGIQGQQGPVGQIGPDGYAVAGAQGAVGPTGPVGDRGPAGAQGPAGGLVVGPTGATGATGPAGAQGAIGQTGVRGASADGHAGAAGVAGQQGPVGPTGPTGARGPDLVGPAGRAGQIGASGEQGEAGQVGAQGRTTPGTAGQAGASGAVGAPGPIGPTGPQGPVGVVERWTSYRNFQFNADSSVIRDADRSMTAEIASYLRSNPSLQVGIDASTNPRATSPRDIELCSNRAAAVRSALIQSGVPADRISIDSYGDIGLRQDGRVELLLKTDPQAREWTARTEPLRTDEQVREQPARDWDSQAIMDDRMTLFREFWFEEGQTAIHRADAGRVSEIAETALRHPQIQIGIDNGLALGRDDQRQADLSRRRGESIRAALVTAGVPDASIRSGDFSNAALRRNGRVDVFVHSDVPIDAEMAPINADTVVSSWTHCRDFWFDSGKSVIHPADASKITHIAEAMKQNQSLQAGIDASVPSGNAGEANAALVTRRGAAVRTALIAAGVPASRITIGTFGDTLMRRDGKVEVLLITDQYAQRP